jgi:plastocyanin
MRSANIRYLVALLAVSIVISPALAGSISGTVKFEGAVPKMRPVKMDADPGCAKKHTTTPTSEALVLGEGNTMGNVFVRIKSGLPDKAYPAPSTPVVLDQDGCRYIPHVIGAMKGQEIKILNSDGLLHNVHALPKVNKTFNMAMPASRTEAVVTFSEEESMFKIKCDVHPWMVAYVQVMSHPFFGVTGKDGKFKIDGLPAGTYEVEVWHEKLKTKSSTVTIAGDENKTADFSFSAPQRK